MNGFTNGDGNIENRDQNWKSEIKGNVISNDPERKIPVKAFHENSQVFDRKTVATVQSGVSSVVAAELKKVHLWSLTSIDLPKVKKAMIEFSRRGYGSELNKPDLRKKFLEKWKKVHKLPHLAI